MYTYYNTCVYNFVQLELCLFLIQFYFIELMNPITLIIIYPDKNSRIRQSSIYD